MVNKRRRYDEKSGMAAGVDYLLRQQGRLDTNPKISAGIGATAADDGTIPIEPTFLVAASDARTAIRNVADFRCSGTDDQVEINAALDAASGGGRYSRVMLTEGNFEINLTGAQWAEAITMDDASLVGVGTSTVLNMNSTGGTHHYGIACYRNCIVSDLMIDVTNTGNDMTAIAAVNSLTRLNLNNCMFTGIGSSSADNVTYVAGNVNPRIVNCEFIDLYFGGA